jgi:hypothetical protein
MDLKFRKFYLEWWKIRKSTIYGSVLVIVLIVGGVVGGSWVIRRNWFAPNDLSAIPKDAARIISFEGDVRITRAATRETLVVTKQTWVAAGDTIQTQSDGRATIQMIDGSIYSVRPNSSVVIRDNSSIFGGRNVRVALDDGQLNVRTEQQPVNTNNIVEMHDSETRLRSQTDASFNADAVSSGGEIRISRGSVETSVGGDKTTIVADEFVAVDKGRLTAKEQLLPSPRPIAPENAAQLVDSADKGVTVLFVWQDVGGRSSSSYHLQVSRSPYFAVDAILVDRSGLTSRDFRLAGLGPGTYYWRMKAKSQSRQTSEWSEPSRFNIVRREAARAIDVAEWDIDRVGGNIFIVSGRTERGMKVRSLGREVFAAADGSFRLQVSTPLSEVAVELSDESGNRAGFVISVRTSKVLRRF